MPDLAQIVNALLRDVAKARFGSDLYARDIARYYESDGLLRRFPVPRPEVSEVEFDLKFLVDSLRLEPTQHELTEATLATVFEPHVDRLTQAVLATAAEKATDEEWRGRLASAPARITLRQAFLKVLTESWGRPTEREPSPDVTRGAAALRAAAREFVLGELRPTEAQRAAAAPLADAIARDARLEPLLGALRDELARAAADRGDCRVEVAVASDRLNQAAAGAISTVRVKAAVRNYVWTQIEQPSEEPPPEPTRGDGEKAPEPPRVWRSLNPE